MYHFFLTSLTSLSILACSTQKNQLQENQQTVTQSPKPTTGKSKSSASAENTGSFTSEKNITSQQTKKMAGTVYFKEGESTFLKDQEMTFTFTKMLDDSRCPTGVNCVWEGVATAQIELMGSYTRPVKAKLSTVNNPQRGYDDKAIFNGYQFTLVHADPHPTVANGFSANSGKYTIGIRIDKIAQNSIEPSTR